MDAPKREAGARHVHVRYLIISLLFVVTTINYADRATLSIAGTALSRDLHFDPITMGYMLSAYAVAYVIGQIPGGMFLDRYGSKTTYIWSLALWSMFTITQGFVGALTGLSAAVMLYAMRFAVGLASAPCFPANARIVSNWFPTAERGTATAIFNSAQYFALVAFAPLMGWLVHEFDWPSVFFVMGGVGIVAVIIFARFVHSPLDHPAIGKQEFDFIEKGGALIRLDEKAVRRPSQLTWHNVGQILSNPTLVGIYLGQYCINVLTYFFVTWFPIYLVQQRGMSILQAGFFTALPALCGFFGGILGGVASDFILKRTGSLTLARKLPLLLGMLLATLIVTCNYVDAQWLVVAIMAIGFFGKGVAALGWAVVSDTSPKELLGLSFSIFNTAGNTAGIVTPIIIGYIVARTGSFDSALIFVGAHCFLAIFSYFVIAGKIRRLELSPTGRLV
jgi:ACS family glucarate transporter-like MFS transporter